MGLIEDLHAAVADPPAPEFDLDHLVQRGRRRRTTSRTLVGLAACAAVGLIIGGMFAATASRPSGGRTLPVAVAPPLVAPTPRTVTPAATTTEERLTAALALLPKSLHVPADGTVHFTRMASDHPAPDWFTAGWSYHGIGYTIEVFDEPMPGETPAHRPTVARTAVGSALLTPTGSRTSSRTRRERRRPSTSRVSGLITRTSRSTSPRAITTSSPRPTRPC